MVLLYHKSGLSKLIVHSKAPTSASPDSMDFQLDPFPSLQMTKNLEKILGPRVALWTKHAHEAFGGLFR